MARGPTGRPGAKLPGPDKWDDEMRAAFCEALGKYGVLQGACDAVGISYEHMNKTRKADKAFDENVKAALRRYNNVLREEAHRRAVEGWVERPIVEGGEIVGEVRKVSDTLMALLLKRTDPGFKERVEHDGKLKTDSTVTNAPLDISCLTKKEQATFIRLVAKIKKHAEEQEQTSGDGGD